jgi:hypothetical protein
MGYAYDKYKKGLYFDGHERSDVVEYSIVEGCCYTKCCTELVVPETSLVYSCYLSKLGIKLKSTFYCQNVCKVTLHNIKNECNYVN